MKIFLDSKIAKTILFKGYYTIMLFGCVFTKNKHLKESTQIHESIHAKQWIEISIVSFLLT